MFVYQITVSPIPVLTKAFKDVKSKIAWLPPSSQAFKLVELATGSGFTIKLTEIVSTQLVVSLDTWA